jgi:hypothetical protein
MDRNWKKKELVLGWATKAGIVGCYELRVMDTEYWH